MDLGTDYITIPTTRTESRDETGDGEPARALITSARNGIDREFAGQLAAWGVDVVVLHGHNPTKLTRVRDELQVKHDPFRAFRILVVDPATTGYCGSDPDLPCSDTRRCPRPTRRRRSPGRGSMWFGGPSLLVPDV
ncbi:hypothetical protein SLS62_005457 [Diatrype stigma]|uniref:Uncharacterized protein n=1 Tax=Diatrype stigma TaxID=117547 RepID=A0AAN9V0D0_9PEZI